MEAKAICPCCKQEVVVKYKPAKWQGEKDKVVIAHKKWQPSWGDKFIRNSMGV